eukprot:Tamp_25309.p2 GENE.Tamp_25309~~Tamp_25309.p2  ORF type:complete len:245 (-),score=43.50 Tamp_25309:4-738(-)
MVAPSDGPLDFTAERGGGVMKRRHGEAGREPGDEEDGGSSSGARRCRQKTAGESLLGAGGDAGSAALSGAGAPPEQVAAQTVPEHEAADLLRAPAATLLSRCSRSDLEALLLRKIADGTPTVAQDVAVLLPQAKTLAVTPAPKPVSRGAQRVGTGRFDALDDELLKNIMKKLPFVPRLACANAVCKAWRQLRAHDSLWTELVVCGRAEKFEGYSWSSHERDTVKCSSKGRSKSCSKCHASEMSF